MRSWLFLKKENVARGVNDVVDRPPPELQLKAARFPC